jgi:hypothetical protein
MRTALELEATTMSSKRPRHIYTSAASRGRVWRIAVLVLVLLVAVAAGLLAIGVLAPIG